MSGGYIKLHRKVLDSAVWQAGEGVFTLWCFLLLRASHKPRQTAVRLGRHVVVVDLRAGEYLLRERLAAEELRVSRRTVIRRLAVLERCKCVKVRRAQRGLRITKILKWRTYQSTQDGGALKSPVCPQPTQDGGAPRAPVSSPPSAHIPSSLIFLNKNKEEYKKNGTPLKESLKYPTTDGPWILPEAKLSEYRQTYPDLDVDAELRRARQWLLDHPSRRKTPRGMTRYLGGWLGRAARAAAKQKADDGEKSFDDLIREASNGATTI